MTRRAHLSATLLTFAGAALTGLAWTSSCPDLAYAQQVRTVTPQTVPGAGQQVTLPAVANAAALPTTGQRIGQCRPVKDTGAVWCCATGGGGTACAAGATWGSPSGSGGGSGTVTNASGPAGAITWSGSGTGLLTAAVAGPWPTATGFAATPTLCPAGGSGRGIDINGNAVNCSLFLPYTVDGFGNWNTSLPTGKLLNYAGGLFATSNGNGGFNFNDLGGDGIIFTSAGGGIDFKDFGNGFLFNSLNTASPGSAGSDFTAEGDWIELNTHLGQASTAPHDRHISLISGTGPILIDASTGAGSVTVNAGTGGITLNKVPALPAQSAFFVFGNCSSSSAAPAFCALTGSMIPVLNQNTTGTAAGLSVTASVGIGGTGDTTLPAHGVLIGEGTSPVATVGASCTAGQVLTCNTSADPSFQAATGGGGTPGGSSGAIQYNNSGNFGGSNTTVDAGGNIFAGAGASIQNFDYIRAGSSSSQKAVMNRGTEPSGRTPGFTAASDRDYCITSGASTESGFDWCIQRVGTNTAKITDANGGGAWQQWAGECYTSADATNATTTMASTGCTISNLIAGGKYTFQCELYLSDSTSVDGAKIDFNGGSATSTYFRAQVTAFDTALNLSSQVTSLSTASSASTFTGAGAFEVHGSFEPLAGGTFIPEFAQVGHTTGTLTLARGSFCRMFSTP